MRGLFLKIFAIFWVSQSLIVIISTALIVAKRFPSPTTVSEALDLNLQHNADAGTAAYRARGCAGFQDNGGRNEPGGAALLDARMRPICQTAGLHAPDRPLAESMDRIYGREVDGRFFWFVPVGSVGGEALTYAWYQPPQPQSVHEGHNFRRFAFPWLPVAIAVGGITTLVMTFLLSRPIVRLRKAARQMAEGNLSARVPQPKGAVERAQSDDMDGLVSDFNYMAGRLESLVGAQRLLLRDVSHELRSPLSRLSVALELAREESGPGAEMHLDRIEREAERLNELIGQLLTLSSLESLAEPPVREAVSVNELCRTIVHDADYEARHRSCSVGLVEEAECMVDGDAPLLHRALENIVRNAVRYTEPGTAVSLRVAPAGNGMVLVEIDDCGPGIPPKEMANIFRPFYRLDSSRTQSTGGYGVGLAITERAIKLHGGDVTVSNRTGGGLTVTVRLPRSSS